MGGSMCDSSVESQGFGNSHRAKTQRAWKFTHPEAQFCSRLPSPMLAASFGGSVLAVPCIDHEKQNCIIGDPSGRCQLNASRANLCPHARHADCSEKVAKSFWFGKCDGNQLGASRVGKAWRVLDAATRHEDKEDGVSACEAALWVKHAREAFATLPPRRICEIGLNAGRSALMWLCAFPTAEYHAFDNFGHNATHRAAAILRRAFPGRFHSHVGNTRATLPELGASSLECDAISIDGAHDVETAASDLGWMARHAARARHVLLMDDLRCPWWVCESPTRVWERAVATGLVRETGCWIAGRYGGWCTGEYLRHST
jgi:hypothetical protein